MNLGRSNTIFLWSYNASMSCAQCGRNVETYPAQFKKITGLIFATEHVSIGGLLCRECSHEAFLEFTGTNLTMGWLAGSSFLLSPLALATNFASISKIPEPERVDLETLECPKCKSKRIQKADSESIRTAGFVIGTLELLVGLILINALAREIGGLLIGLIFAIVGGLALSCFWKATKYKRVQCMQSECRLIWTVRT